MPLTDELRAFFEDLDSDPSAEDVADALKEVRQPAYQAVYDRGHGGATSRLKSEQEDLEQQLAETQGELEKAQSRIEELEGENPDVAEIRAEYEEEMDELRQRHEEELNQVKSTLREERVGGARSKLVSRMVSLGLDADFAEVMADRHQDRIQFEDGEVQVLQEGKNIPLQATDENGPIGQLAREVYEGADPKWKVSEADGGAGTQSGGGGGSQDSKYDRIRENAKEERERRKVEGPTPEERLGMATGA